MKSKLILRTMGLLILMASLFVFFSCSKSADGNLTEKEQQDKNLVASSIDNKDFTESDEDLTSVDYKEFYDQLSPHGEWVQVKPEEIGLQSKTALSKSNNSFSLSNLLGIKNAYAESDVNVDLVYVWKPSADLGVTMVAGEAPVYRPYSNGQWINTDAGWYFKAATPVEETVSHYGRWVNSPTAGWLWVPGRVWAPAWVDWKQNDTYVSWAPLPPSVYLVNGIMSTPVINENYYVIVERKYFLEPSLYKYNTVYYNDGSRILVSEMTGTDGIVVVNNTIINRGPDVNIIQTIYGRNIELVKIQQVRNFKDARYSDKDYYVYNQDFKRYKNKENKKFTINEPKSFKKYDQWKVAKSEGKELKKEEKEIRKENKGNDNSKKYNENNNGRKFNSNDNDMKQGNNSDKKQNGNDNGKKYNDNNGQKYDGNGKGNKNNGDNKGGKNNGDNKGKGKNK
ncbi:MAG TPA: DUF6600 domain-containing protein [Ignavibacteria bacterium]|jgi:hypothetical protein